MKKLVKVLPIVLMLVVIASSFLPVFADTIDPSTIKGTTGQTGKVTALGQNIIGVVQAIGSVVAVLVLVILGIKYMMGSAEEKAEYKKTFIPYIVGAILVFAASNIAGAVYQMVNGWQ